VFFVGTTLRKSVRLAIDGQLKLPRPGRYAISTADGIQSATLTFTGDEIQVVHGVAPDAECALSFELDGPFSWTESLATMSESTDVGALQALLNPPPIEWKQAAQRFWDLNVGTPGFPDQLIVRCEDFSEEITFGTDGSVYVISGPSANLSRVLEGIDSIGDAAYLGSIKVEGSFAQLSVMVGAGWKVRFYG
jgi:hypothetical protein